MPEASEAVGAPFACLGALLDASGAAVWGDLGSPLSRCGAPGSPNRRKRKFLSKTDWQSMT
eukprot:8499564-Pyramimonas_sp.AAC.1